MASVGAEDDRRGPAAAWGEAPRAKVMPFAGQRHEWPRQERPGAGLLHPDITAFLDAPEPTAWL